MFDTTTTNVKNRIDAINPTTTAKSAVNNGIDKAHEIATGVPAKARHTFETAFREAFAALSHYGEMTARAYKQGFKNYEDAFTLIREGYRMDDAELILNNATRALEHLFDGTLDLVIGDAMSVPLQTAFTAGVELIGGTISLSTVAQLAVPVMFTIAVGYASLKLRDIATSKMAEMVSDALDSVTGLDDDDFDALDFDDTLVEGTEDGNHECPEDDCEEAFEAPLNLSEHVAVDHGNDDFKDGGPQEATTGEA